MWTNAGLSPILLVKIKQRGKIGFTIPLVITVIDELIESLADWAWLFDRFFPLWKQRILHIQLQRISLEEALGLIQELFTELRKHRKLRLVEVDADDIYVKLELM